MDNILTLLGIILSSLAFLGYIYMFVYWKAQVDADRQVLKKYPLAELATMTKTLWDIYIVDALHNRPDLATHRSSLQIQPEGEALIPEEVRLVLKTVGRCEREFETSSWLVVKCLGIDQVRKLSMSMSLNMADTVALLTAYYEKHHNVPPASPDCAPKKP